MDITQEEAERKLRDITEAVQRCQRLSNEMDGVPLQDLYHQSNLLLQRFQEAVASLQRESTNVRLAKQANDLLMDGYDRIVALIADIQEEQSAAIARLDPKHQQQLTELFQDLKSAWSSHVGSSSSLVISELNRHTGHDITTLTGYEDGLTTIITASSSSSAMPTQDPRTSLPSMSHVDHTRIGTVNTHHGHKITQVESESSKLQAKTQATIALHQAGVLREPEQKWKFKGIVCHLVYEGAETYYRIKATISLLEERQILDRIQSYLTVLEEQSAISSKTVKNKKSHITSLYIPKDDEDEVEALRKKIEGLNNASSSSSSSQPNPAFISQARDVHFNSPVFVGGTHYVQSPAPTPKEKPKALPKHLQARYQTPVAAPSVSSTPPVALNHPSLTEIEISLRGLTLLRDSFEQLVPDAIPKNGDGQIKPGYQDANQAAFRFLKNMDSILRRLYDSYSRVSQNPSDRHLTMANREMLLEQQNRLKNKIARLQSVVEELPKPLLMARSWNTYCNQLSDVLSNPDSVREDCERDTLKHSYLQQYCETLARIPLRSRDGKKPTCFISYSWGFARHTMRVHTLARYLQAAGIEVNLDVWRNKVGSVSIFLDQIECVDFILVMGSEDLLEKWVNKVTSGESRDQTEVRYKGHVVAEELSRIEGAMRRTPAKLQHVLPILLSGTQETSLPFAFRDLATSALSLTDGSRLTTVVWDLLKRLYEYYPEMQAPLADYQRDFEDQIQTLAGFNTEAVAQEYARLTGQGNHQSSSLSHP